MMRPLGQPITKRSKRTDFRVASLIICLLMRLPGTFAHAQDTPAPAATDKPTKPTVRLVEDPRAERLLDVTATLDVRGRVLAPVGVDRVVPLPLAATGQLAWQMRRLKPTGDFQRSLRAVRRFETAVSSVRVDRRTTESSLRLSRRTIVSEGTPSGLRHYSLDGPLGGDEIELLDLPADPLALLGLLPQGLVPHDHTWTPGKWTLTLVTGLDAVNTGTLKGQLVKVTDTTAEAVVEGTAEGAVGGARSKVTFHATLLFDHKLGFLRHAQVTIEEHRQAGPVSPGLEVVAQVRIDRKPVTGPSRLKLDIVTICPKQPGDNQLQLSLQTPGHGRLLHDRNWHIFHQTPEVAILRRLVNGQLVAQCNLSKAPNVQAGAITSREEFLRDVKSALGTRLRELVSVESLQADASRTTQRSWKITATGIDHGLPMHWFYYLCNHPSGRQLSLVFAVESQRIKDWHDTDRNIVSRLNIVPTPTRAARR